MIIILKKGTAPQKVNEMVSHFEQMNFQVQEIRGVHETILGLIGDTSRLDTEAADTSRSSQAPARWRAASRWWRLQRPSRLRAQA